MKARELRIGNLVTDLNSLEMFVTLIGNDYIHADFKGNEGGHWEINGKDIRPVSITEDWLKRAGFEIKDWGIKLVNIWSGKQGKNFGMRWIEPENEPPFLRKDGMTINIQYVHQLQNLFYALTGTELEFTEL